MNWIDKILPVIALILGFGLSQFGKYFTDRKNDRKKLRNLLFNLLELRWLLKQETELFDMISTYIEKAKLTLFTEFGPEAVEGIEYIKPTILDILKAQAVDPEKILRIENSIDSTIIELSEIYPIFAYELIGRFKIKERLGNAENYFHKVENLVGELPLDVKNWIEPRLSKDLILDIDQYIQSIAKRIGRKTNKDVFKILNQTKPTDTSKIDLLINDYIKEVKKSMADGR